MAMVTMKKYDAANFDDAPGLIEISGDIKQILSWNDRTLIRHSFPVKTENKFEKSR